MKKKTLGLLAAMSAVTAAGAAYIIKNKIDETGCDNDINFFTKEEPLKAPKMRTSVHKKYFCSDGNDKRRYDSLYTEDEDSYIDPRPYKDKAFHKKVNEDASPNMILSEHYKKSLRMPDDNTCNNNVLFVGQPGNGKVGNFLIPNLLNMNASFVVLDPIGEMLGECGLVLKEHGYKIKVLNIDDMEHSYCYNPLKYVKTEADVKTIVDCLIKNTKGLGSKNDEFFIYAEKLFYSACIFYLIDHCNNEEKKNLLSLKNMINASTVDNDASNTKSELDKLFDELPKESLAWKYYKAFKQIGGKTEEQIRTSCIYRVELFSALPVTNLIKKDELELEAISDEKTALFVITPQYNAKYTFFSAILYSQVVNTLKYSSENKKKNNDDKKFRYPVRLMMNDFIGIGVIPDFLDELSNMNKYGVSATIVLQNIYQFEKKYGKNAVKNIEEWFWAVIYYGSISDNDLVYMPKELSKGIESFNAINRFSDDWCFLFIKGEAPVIDTKYKCQAHPMFGYLANQTENQKRWFYPPKTRL